MTSCFQHRSYMIFLANKNYDSFLLTQHSKSENMDETQLFVEACIIQQAGSTININCYAAACSATSAICY